MPKITSFAQLEQAGGIVSRQPVKREISWKAVDPNTGEEVEYEADIMLLKLGSGALADIWGKKEPDREEVAVWISKAFMLLNDKGKHELISYDKAYLLDAPLRQVIWKEIQVLAGMQKKSLPLSTNSSVSSSAEESADAPSKKPENV